VIRGTDMQSNEISQALESWYSRQQGDELCERLRSRLQPVLDLCFGYHILQMGPVPRINLIDGSPINHRIFASPETSIAVGQSQNSRGSTGSVYCHSDELPLESDSLDMLIAFHALEFDEHPHGALREMQRVLRPHGHLVIIGFNPHSLLGVSQYLRRLARRGPWSTHRPVSVRRLQDWLNLLHCEVESIQHLYPIPLAGQGRVRAAINRVDQWTAERNLPGGGVYIAHAIKQIGALRRPQPLGLLARRRLVGLAVAGRPSPTPRQGRQGMDHRDIAA
jgi:SAM-dependent methyltransferase